MKQSHVRILREPPRYPGVVIYAVWTGAITVLGFLLIALAPVAGIGLPAVAPDKAEVSSNSPASELYSPDSARREQAIKGLARAAQAGSADATASLVEFFQRDEYVAEHGLATARAIASAGTRSALQVLIQALRQDQPRSRQRAAMTVLAETQSMVTAVLIEALRDPDAGVRRSCAELLGIRQDLAAATALTAATFDSEPTVRAASIWALGGDLGVWNALARSQFLAASDPDERVRATAKRAEDRIRSRIARVVGIEDFLLVSVAPATGLIYAASSDTLYVIRDSSHWHVANVLPAHPTALAAGGRSGQTVYLGTFGSGPFRSNDGGRTWNRITTGLPAAERLSVTSMVITSEADADAQFVTMDVSATFGTTELHTTPLGTFRTIDGGNHWLPVVEGPSAPNQCGGKCPQL